MKINKCLDNLWQFLRGDFKLSEFEKWIYSSNELESVLNEELYLNLISLNYSDKMAILNMKKLLTDYLSTNFNYNCFCHRLRNVDVVSMGSDKHDYLKLFRCIKHRGEPYCWLYLSKCDTCNQYWLVAEETRHNDNFIIKRLLFEDVEQIENCNNWPRKFETFEELLKISTEMGHTVRYPSLYASSLLYSVEDLRNERPDITSGEISSLLNIDIDWADYLMDLPNQFLQSFEYNVQIQTNWV